MSKNRRALFLDRDGVLTEPVWNPATGEYESPHAVDELRMCENIAMPLKQALSLGFDLFIVSNQPSYAKGKASLADLMAVAERVNAFFQAAGVRFRDAFYCFHHPNGVIPEYSRPCHCRKPSPYFLHQAATRHHVDLRASWMIGDRDTDVECGQRAGCHTVLILHPRAGDRHGQSRPTVRAADLADAITQIVAHESARSSTKGPGPLF
jgi:D-glycero-D-manno-heptose 1,7-bisphosphate phosphatase